MQHEMETMRLKAELEQVRKQVIVPIVSNSHFDNFLACAQATKKDLYVVKSKFYIKVANFMGFFFKFQEYVDEGKHCQAKME